ncbi:MAG TPA: sensor histidine kinase, partial [Myxococcota bacterium]|nr:sensor histidine kinase [Myxococcota bacterium]
LSDTVRRSVLVVGPITSAAVAAQIGAALGPLGVDGAPWYADALIAPIPIAMLPLPLGRRLLATGPTSVALAASWVATAPDGRTATTYMAGQLSFSLFSWLLTVVMGELFYRTVRRSYFQQRQLDHARREVERINATLVERVEAQTRQLRQLAHQLQHAQESERRHLSRELHDELGQDLTAIRLTLSLVDQRFITAPSAIGPLLAQLGQLVRRATATTRTIVEGLRPKVVEDLGLLAGASWLCRTLHESSGVPCELHGEPGCDEGLAPDAAVALFRVLQESMSNALKHGHPEHVRVEVTRREHELTVSVTDDGGGFDPAAPARGLGMVGMRERVRAFGGALDVRSAPGQGSVVQATVPVHPERAATTADEETSRASARVHRGRP